MTTPLNSVAAIEAALIGLLKGEHSSLTISFNDHASNYCDVKKAIELGMLDRGEWVSEEEKQKAIATNRVWSVHWYPDTPIGFYDVLASTLEAALTEALEGKKL